MKKVLALLMVAGMFSLVACGPTEEEKAKAEADAAAMVEEMMGGMEDAMMEEPAVEEEEMALAAHVCNDDCTEEACSFKCGEEGHECTEACHADAEEGHDHAEGEEHSEEEAH